MTEKSWNLRYKSKWQVLYSRYFDRVFDNSKISRFVDTKSFLGMREGLSKCLADFLKSPKFLYDEDIENLHRLYETELRVGFCEIHGANVDSRFDILERRIAELEKELDEQKARKTLLKKITQKVRKFL